MPLELIWNSTKVDDEVVILGVATEPVDNAFCPTGPGGGIDPHCGPGNQPSGPQGAIKLIKALPGSTNPQLVKDKNGVEWVRKSGKNTSNGHIENEHDADMAYKALGVPTPESHLRTESGHSFKYGKYLEHGQTLAQWIDGKPEADKQAAFKEVGKHFVADALLGNWDSVGTGMSNILFHGGTAYRIDNGGALKYRAQGALKNVGDFDNNAVKDLEGMRDPKKSPEASKVFGHLTVADIKDQITSLLPKKQAVLEAIKDPVSKAIVEKRFDSLVDWYNQHSDTLSSSSKEALTKVKSETAHEAITALKAQYKPNEPIPITAVTGLHLDHVNEMVNSGKLGFDPGKQHYFLTPESSPLPSTYAGLKPGHKYVNSQGKTKEVETAEQLPNGMMKLTFKGEPGHAMIPATKAFSFSAPGEPAKPTGVAGVVIPKFTAGTPSTTPYSSSFYSKPSKPIKMGMALADIVTKSSPKLAKVAPGTFIPDPSHPKTGIELAHSIQKSTDLKTITKVDLKKLAMLNPEGIKDGSIVFPAFTAGGKFYAPKLEMVAGALPPGTKIKIIKSVLKKKGKDSADAGDAVDSKFGETTGPLVLEKGAEGTLAGHKKVIDALPHEVKSAIKGYTNSDYHSLNKAMRECAPNFECLDSYQKKKMELIKQGIEAAPVFSKPVVVRRGISVGSTTEQQMIAQYKGFKDNDDTFELPSFTSTSLKHGFSGNIRYEIVAKHGLYVQSLSSHKSEYEVIMHPNAKYKVVDVLDKGGGKGNYLVKLEQVL